MSSRGINTAGHITVIQLKKEQVETNPDDTLQSRPKCLYNVGLIDNG